MKVMENRAVIARLEYRAVQPEDWRYILAGVLVGRVDPAPIVAELERKLLEDPGSVRARVLLAQFRRAPEKPGNQAGAPNQGR